MERKFLSGFGIRKKYRGKSDEELLSQFTLHNSNEVIDEFFNRYVHLVYGLCLNYLKDDEHARDITMQIFESLAEKFRKFEIQHFKSWLYTVSRNACLMELRKTKYEKPVDRNEMSRLLHVEFTEDMHLLDEEDPIEENLMVYLHKLNNKQRTCLDLMYFQKMTYKEIADETGLTLKEVKSHIQNGKRNLRNLLSSGNEK